MSKIRYFDFDKNLWVDKRPSKETGHGLSPGSQLTVCPMDLKELESGDRQFENFVGFLAADQPTVVLLHHASSWISRIKSNRNVRKTYAVVEARGNSDDSCIALVVAAAPIEIIEAFKENKCLKPTMAFTVGNAKSASLAVLVLSVEAGILLQRSSADTSIPLKASDADAIFLACNISASSVTATREGSTVIKEICKSSNYMDVIEQLSEKSPDAGSSYSANNWSFWLRSTKYEVIPTPTSRNRRNDHLCVTLGPRASPGVDMPVPRSAKAGSGGSVGLPKSNAPQVLADPAVLSAESAVKTAGNDIFMLLKKNSPRWKLEQSFQLKPQDGKLTPQELLFDLSKYFNSPKEALEMLNMHPKEWVAEYCVIQQTVFYTDAVGTADRQLFRRYAKEYSLKFPGSSGPLASSLNTSASSLVPTPTSSLPQANLAASVWTQRAQTGNEYSFSRGARIIPEVIREWSESSCIIIYQTTPREMKFNISQRVPLTKDALKQTILYLNKSVPQERNPLYDYQYDYALLYSIEHQGFWLIAAKHVPCDIVACRMIV